MFKRFSIGELFAVWVLHKADVQVVLHSLQEEEKEYL
jgi:hypothetical protein